MTGLSSGPGLSSQTTESWGVLVCSISQGEGEERHEGGAARNKTGPSKFGQSPFL
jgi:hypothetical protein